MIPETPFPNAKISIPKIPSQSVKKTTNAKNRFQNVVTLGFQGPRSLQNAEGENDGTYVFFYCLQ